MSKIYENLKISNMNQDEDQFDLDLRLFARKISRN